MTKKITIILSLFLFIFVLTIQTGCKKEEPTETEGITKYNEISSIYYEDILAKSGKYYVFIMGNTCEACEELESLICQYATLVQKYPTGYYPIYCLNSDDTENNGDIIAKDGDESYANFQGTKNYQNIKISTTPGFLVIENGRVTKLISTKVTEEPKTEIKSYIEGLTK